MLRASSHRIFIITSILIVLTAIAANANWGGGFGFSLFKGNNAESREAAEPILAPVNIASTWTGSSGNWSTAANWSSNPNFPNNGQPGAGDLYDATLANGSTITRDLPITIENFTLNSGTVNGSNSLTTNQVFTWNNGQLTGASTNIASGGVMNLFGVGTDSLYSTGLNNAGTINFTSGSNNFYLYGNFGASTIQNNSGGVFDLQNSGGTFINPNFNCNFLNNTGATLRKSSIGTSDFGVPLTNNGTVDVQNGTLNLDSGGSGGGNFNVVTGALLKLNSNYDLSNGASFTGVGYTQKTSGTLSITGTVTAHRFDLSGSGTLSVASASSFVIGTGDILDFHQGQLTGAGSTNIASGGVMNLFGVSTDSLYSTGLNNAGTINFTSGSNNFYLYGNFGASTIQNNSGGVFDLQNSGGTFINPNFNCNFLNNTGATLRKSSIGTSDFGVPLTNNGTVDVQNGTLNLDSGGSSSGNFNVVNSATFLFNSAFTLNAGATLTGGGVFRLVNTLTINSGAINSPTDFEFDSGYLSVANGTTFNIVSGKTFNWNNGQITGAGSTNIASGGVMNLFGVSTDSLYSTGLNNAGTINFTSGSNNFYLYGNFGASTIQNNSGGVFDLQNSGGTFINPNFNCNFLNNTGATLRKSSIGTSDFGVPLTNNGTVDVQNGTLNLDSGGSSSGNFNVVNSATFLFNSAFTLNAGATLTGGGVFRLVNTLTINSGAINSPTDFEFDSGYLSVANGTTFNIVSGKTFNWNNGQITGAGSTNIASGGVMNLFGVSTDSLYSTGLNNAGTINFTSGSNNFYLYGNFGASTIQNNSGGVFDLQNSGGTFINPNFNCNFLNNTGATLRKSSIGTSDFGVPLTNNGTVDVQNGTLNLNSGYTHTAGVLSTGSGATVSASGPIDIQAGQVIGNGTISPSLNISSGAVSPGFSVGTLTVTGSLTFGGSSTYNCQVSSDSDTADKLVANGVVITPGSTITLTDIGTGAVSGPLTIIDNTSGSPISGTFSNLANDSIVSVGSNLKVSYAGGDGNDLVLTPFSVAGTITYGNAVGPGPTPPRFVRNVSVASTAGSPAIGPVITGTPGTYFLSGFGAGSYTIKPTKTGGANVAISSSDAARVAQGVSGSVPFVSNNQRFAADTSGNGAVSSTDASKIAQFVTGLPFSPPNFTGQWRFFTSNLPAFPAGAHPQERAYASVTSNVIGEDYIGLLIGETSGNYNPASHARAAMGPERSTAVAAPRLLTPADSEVIIPVSVNGAVNKEIVSYEFDLRYDPSVIQPLENPIDVSGTVSRGLMVVANPYELGLLRVVVYGAFPIDENGVLLNLRFTAVGAAGSTSPLMFERMMFNEGEFGTLVTDGKIELY